MAVSANRLELLQIADAVAREKAIDRGIVIAAMEDAIAKAARSRYGAETDVHAEIEPKTGDLRLTRHMLVVETVENPSNQITLEGARKHHPAAQVGDTIADPLPPLEYGRIAAQSAKDFHKTLRLTSLVCAHDVLHRHGRDQRGLAGLADLRFRHPSAAKGRIGVEPAQMLLCIVPFNRKRSLACFGRLLLCSHQDRACSSTSRRTVPLAL